MAAQLGGDASAAEATPLLALADEGACRRLVVEISLRGAAPQGLLHLAGVVASRQQLVAQVGAEVGALGQQPQRPLVAGQRRGQRSIWKGLSVVIISASPPMRREPSISSREASEVNCTPWILSLNSSGLVARLSASSSVISPAL
jgi:hypothetical protein